MTAPWTHEQVRAELGAYSMGALAPDESSAVEAHLAQCEQCRSEMRATADAAAALSAAVRPERMDPAASAAIRKRLLERARAAPASVVSISSAPGRARLATLPWWLAAAASVAFAVTMYRNATVTRDRDDFRAALIAESLQVAALRDSLEARERTLLAMAGADVKVVELVADNRRPSARMFWAQATNTWTMFAHNMPAPASGRTYQLWLITRDGQRISAGTFAPDSSGNAVVSAQYALDRDALQAIAVTDEPAGGVPQPTGDIVIAGQPR